MLGGANSGIRTDLKEGVGCGVWGVGKENSFICGGENFFIGTDYSPHRSDSDRYLRKLLILSSRLHPDRKPLGNL